MQLEQKGHSTPFTKTSRSSTESLYDFNKTSIDMSSFKFDDNSNPYFDGSFYTINSMWGSGIDVSTTHFTVEAVIKSNIIGTNLMWLDTYGQGTNQRFYSATNDVGYTGLGIQASTWSQTGAPDTDYRHQLITMDGTNAKAYNNGELVVTKGYTPYTMVNNICFGGRGGYAWTGYISIAKVYDRVLSEDEIKQNFNAYKNRFNLA